MKRIGLNLMLLCLVSFGGCEKSPAEKSHERNISDGGENGLPEGLRRGSDMNILSRKVCR
jgi:hypothetical protein